MALAARVEGALFVVVGSIVLAVEEEEMEIAKRRERRSARFALCVVVVWKSLGARLPLPTETREEQPYTTQTHTG